MDIILASKSPRRKELFERTGLSFSVIPSAADENISKSQTPEEYVKTLALQKALSVLKKHPSSLVIGCDTIVYANGNILGKPNSKEIAFEYLTSLQNHTHSVYSGLAIVYDNKQDVEFEKTDVTFSPMTKEEIDWYISTNEPFDKAGGYGIQGYASLFIESIRGDYFNVVGLPMPLLYKMLKRNGFTII